jgi:hypothetical protein
MKLRPVTCIHVAAYLFSALVLGASALSYYWCACLRLPTDFTLFVVRGNVWLAEGFTFETAPVFSVNDASSGIRFPVCQDKEQRYDESCQFGIISYIVKPLCYVGDDPNLQRVPCQIYMMPPFLFLIPPITWMCGFYLFKLRQRFRARSSESQIQSDATGTP